VTDVVVIGSGFGGSVAALRLVEKGYRVTVLEAGRRFTDRDFAKSSWRIRDFLFAPALGCLGIQRLHVLPDVVVMAGAGVGGGSLVYANTLYQPAASYFREGAWAGITDWQRELEPFYDLARKMLGVTRNPRFTPADQAMRAVAERLGTGASFELTPVGVHFGTGPGQRSTDPYFGGVGPDRLGCTHCGECMTGCRHGAKNTVLKNYLALAERAGAVVRERCTVTRIQPRGGRWEVHLRRTGAVRPQREVIACDQIVLAAGTYGTQQLLHRMRDEGVLTNLSPRLGYLSRTNSEALVGAVAPRGSADFSEGVAITSSFYADPHTHIQPVRYGHRSNAMGLLATHLIDFSRGGSAVMAWLRTVVGHPMASLRLLWVRGWSQRTVIALVMQSVDNSLTVFGARSRWGRWRLRTRAGEGQNNPSWLPAAHTVASELANHLAGTPLGNIGEVLGKPFTAHFVGGAVIGDSPATGVVDAYHRVFGYPGLHIVDGSTIAGNLGVNPSLTITAQAERALALWPNAGDPDPRPLQGYRELPLVTPRAPVVPQHAPAALFY
jgi:cholesterol oxidase